MFPKGFFKKDIFLFPLLLAGILSIWFYISAEQPAGSEVYSGESVEESSADLPFYKDAINWLSASQLSRPTESYSEGSGFAFLSLRKVFSGYTDCLLGSLSLSNDSFHLLFKRLILFPFHSFW